MRWVLFSISPNVASKPRERSLKTYTAAALAKMGDSLIGGVNQEDHAANATENQ